MEELADIVTDECMNVCHENVLWKCFDKYINYIRPNRENGSTTYRKVLLLS